MARASSSIVAGASAHAARRVVARMSARRRAFSTCACHTCCCSRSFTHAWLRIANSSAAQIAVVATASVRLYSVMRARWRWYQAATHARTDGSWWPTRARTSLRAEAMADLSSNYSGPRRCVATRRDGVCLDAWQPGDGRPSAGARLRHAGEPYPLVHAQSLGAARGVDRGLIEPAGDDLARGLQVVRQRIVQLFAPLREPSMRDAEQQVAGRGVERWLGVHVHPHDGRIYQRRWIEAGRPDDAHQARLAIELDADAQQAEVAGRGHQPLGHLLLDHHDEPRRATRRLQKVAQRRRSDVIG